jgi:hypothetical protein
MRIWAVSNYVKRWGSSHNILTTVQLAKFWESIQFPGLSEDDIKDKSKSDFLTKAVALL